ncbi:transglycosylase SLT domain-containing protein [Paraburkholderia bonniea]|uniref:transglycosylase SLT domain-containing protein n=1 Tax=Paraburkholderia bonniea TaxID=2152891 RepID=UPI001292AD1C|nr:transglycosylase SLT domain-containing protein [Paraburkholderia bonniea]WJF91859.1 transglycosylase SLT domain-containing protein [Paraburkholderia bonniea]WJF95178.1 transglycosylase SLT domain-containing protein [Paraburkholderia bonniea]
MPSAVRPFLFLFALLPLALTFAPLAQAEPVPDYLVREFGVAQAKAELISAEVQLAAEKYALPPALLLAIISIESRFKEKAHGANGATGLMQVVPSAHRRLLKGVKDLTEPSVNIELGSAILHGYLQAAGGDLQAALKSYGGSRAYAEKVSQRTQRFERALGVQREKPQDTTLANPPGFAQ